MTYDEFRTPEGYQKTLGTLSLFRVLSHSEPVKYTGCNKKVMRVHYFPIHLRTMRFFVGDSGRARLQRIGKFFHKAIRMLYSYKAYLEDRGKERILSGKPGLRGGPPILERKRFGRLSIHALTGK